MKVARIERDPRGLTSEVRGKIIDAMMDGELVPGDRLILDTLADQLGVSRTPVRDHGRGLRHLLCRAQAQRGGAICSFRTGAHDRTAPGQRLGAVRVLRSLLSGHLPLAF
ncbi:MAG: GntR family transcriptional regulator [Nocardioidaceae bacterium]|nr:GntR family transcriptional regulator [Nocardioidaceae bacterium]